MSGQIPTPFSSLGGDALRMPSLSNDELKAAEAAFRGRPADPSWSDRGQAVYQGILAQTNGRDIVEAVRCNIDEAQDAQVSLVGANT